MQRFLATRLFDYSQNFEFPPKSLKKKIANWTTLKNKETNEIFVTTDFIKKFSFKEKIILANITPHAILRMIERKKSRIYLASS